MKRNKLFTSEFRDSIMSLMNASGYSPLTAQEITTKLKIRGGARKAVGKALDAMVLNGEIVRIRKNRYSLGEPADLFTGNLLVFRSGDGVVKSLENSDEVFVLKGDMSTALPGDKVVVRLDPARDTAKEKRVSGRVIRILERTRKALTGTLRSTRNFYYVVPVDPVYQQDFYVPDPKEAKLNDRVVIKFVGWENQHVNPEAEIIEVIGPQDNPSLDTLAIMRHFDLPESFPEEVVREAEDAAGLLDQPGTRANFTDKFTFTIDPEKARDFDDALSLELDSRGRRVLGVHIADVSHFVKQGGALDSEAEKRGNTVYLPDKVIPMLPEELSNGLCSLRPREDRLTFSVMITFDDAGAPVKREFFRSIIRSRLRLTYRQALQALGTGSTRNASVAGLDRNAVSLLADIHRLAQQLRKRRFESLALDMDMPDFEIVIGPDGMITDIQKEENDISHQLIEECMVAANEAVDREISTKGRLLVHRVHEPPARRKLAELRIQLEEMGFKPGDLTRRRNLTNFLKSTRGHPLEYYAVVAVLKSMRRAEYSAAPAGHYGLAKKYYAHFTSPIRRYPDLVVHRILNATLCGRKPPYEEARLTSVGKWCTKTEFDAEIAERTLVEIKKYRYLEQHLEDSKPMVHPGVVISVHNFGMFVELTELQVQGLVKVSRISSTFVKHEKHRRALCSGKKSYTVGARVDVVVTGVNLDSRRIELSVADGKKSRASAEKKKAVGRGKKPKNSTRTRK